jgi:hypothetical protein
VLQKLSEHITYTYCLGRAADAEQRADQTSDETIRVDNEKMARSWRLLASSYQFAESLERFLLDAGKAKGAGPPSPPMIAETPIFSPAGVPFDSGTMAALIGAHNTLEGTLASVREAAAERIVELASKGERDPDKLCREALSLCMLERRSRH